MKKIDVVIEPYKLADVKESLAEIGVTSLTVSEVRKSELEAAVEIQNGKRGCDGAVMPTPSCTEARNPTSTVARSHTRDRA
jgi:hypothetical protein